MQTPQGNAYASRWISCNEPLSLSADVSQAYYDLWTLQSRECSTPVTTEDYGNNIKRMLLPNNTPIQTYALVYVAAHNSYNIHFGHVELRVG